MKAAFITATGAPDVIRHGDLPDPVPGPREVLVRVRAAAEDAGFRVNLLRDYCRTARLSGLVVGFGGPTDDELDRALAVLVGALSSR